MLVVMRGAGDLATGVAVRLVRAGCRVVLCDVAQPTTVRRTVAFSEAIRSGACTVEGVTARRADDVEEARHLLEPSDVLAAHSTPSESAFMRSIEADSAAENVFGRPARDERAPQVAVLVDPDAACVAELAPDAVVDAIIAKHNLGTTIDMAPAVIGVGPGFTAGVDCHAVVETKRGHDLGRVIWQGSAIPNTGVPGVIAGHGADRVLRAPAAGAFEPCREIGDIVRAGDVVATVSDKPLHATIDGVLRGLLAPGVPVHPGMKAGDIDPRGVAEHCFTISDKARAVGGGVLEALLAITGALA